MPQVKIDKTLFDQIVDFFVTEDPTIKKSLEPQIKQALGEKIYRMSIHDLHSLDRGYGRPTGSSPPPHGTR